jgi:hypothetical protein
LNQERGRTGVAAGQQGRAEARQLPPAEPVRRARSSEGAVRRVAPDGPAFINDQAEEQHHHEVLRDPSSGKAAQAAARIEIARLREARGQFADAAEMYEQNIWAGDRSPATYAGLASAYRELGRDDLADSALEQVRREGGAGRADGAATATQPARTVSRSRTRFSPELTSRMDRPRASRRRGPTEGGARATAAQAAREQPESARSLPILGEIQRAIAPFLAGQAGKKTLVVSTVLLPTVVGLGIFAAVVLTSTRARSADPVPQPTPAPVATVAPTAAPTAAPTVAIPPALTEPPAPARLVVNNVGSDGLSLRRTAGTGGQRIKVWNDGAEMADLGETTENGGKTWRKVRDPDGNVGWVAAEFLAEPGARAGSAPAPAPTLLTTSRAGAGGSVRAGGMATVGAAVGTGVGTAVATGAGVGCGTGSTDLARVEVRTTAAKMPSPTTIGNSTVETTSVFFPA